MKLIEEARKTILECTIADIKAKLDRGEQFDLLDVREDHEYEKDYAKGRGILGEGFSNAISRR